MSADPRVEELFLRFVEHHVNEGRILNAQDLCRGNEDLLEPLQRCIRGYLALDQTLDQGIQELTFWHQCSGFYFPPGVWR